MENLLYGQIVRADNGEGIANLNVAIFDIDSAIVELIKRQYAGDVSLSDVINSQPASASPERVQQILSLVFGPAREEDGELRGDAPAGDRLGSVLTDQVGKFELSFSDEAFNDEKKEKRPDLLLIALGPDTSVDIGGSGFGLPQTHRVVHFSLMPRWNAGRQEAFYIKIPESLFEKAGVRTVQNTESLSISEMLKKDLENQKREHEKNWNVRQDLAAVDMQNEASLNEKSEVVINRILTNLSTSTSRPYFLNSAMPARERIIKRELAITEAQKIGINRLANIGLPSSNGAVFPRPLPIYIPDSVLLPFFPDWNNLTTPLVSSDSRNGLRSY